MTLKELKDKIEAVQKENALEDNTEVFVHLFYTDGVGFSWQHILDIGSVDGKVYMNVDPKKTIEIFEGKQ
jgi:hypothetical protein